MGKQSRRKKVRLVPGEIVRLCSDVGLLPSGYYQVKNVSDKFLELRAGEIVLGVMRGAVKVIERHLPPPKSWLSMEIAVLRGPTSCGCDECRKLLKEKEAALAVENSALN